MTVLYGSIILLIYFAIGRGGIPFLRMSRATLTLSGAALLVGVGAISEHQAIEAIDVGTLLLLGSMMVINSQLKLAGFFRSVANRTLKFAPTPILLLGWIIFVSGGLSALFLNDTLCLMLTAWVVDLTQRLKRNPIPYLIGLATATNVGSVATITGNPQNILIGQASGISYWTFLAYLSPVALMGLLVCWGVIVWLFPQEFEGSLPLVSFPPARPFKPLLYRSILISCGLMLAFLMGMPIITSACIAAGLMFLSRLRPHKLLALDWELLAFFAGLFVITHALETTGGSRLFFEWTKPLLVQGVWGLTLITTLLSNLISNVPAVLLLQTTLAELPHPQQAWLTLAMASTLSGNLTLLGSAATLIVAELAGQKGVTLHFMDFLRAGIPITLITLTIGVLWLTWLPM